MLDLYRDAFINFWTTIRKGGKQGKHKVINNNNVISRNADLKDGSSPQELFSASAWDFLFTPLLRRSLTSCPVDIASRIAELLVDFTLLAHEMPPSRSISFYNGVDSSTQQLTIKSDSDVIDFLTSEKRVGIHVLTTFLIRLINTDAASSSLDVTALRGALLSTWFRFQVCGGGVGGGVANSSAPLSADARHLSKQLFQHHELVGRICKHLNPDFMSLQVAC